MDLNWSLSVEERKYEGAEQEDADEWPYLALN